MSCRASMRNWCTSTCQPADEGLRLVEQALAEAEDRPQARAVGDRRRSARTIAGCRRSARCSRGSGNGAGAGRGRCPRRRRRRRRGGGGDSGRHRPYRCRPSRSSQLAAKTSPVGQRARRGQERPHRRREARTRSHPPRSPTGAARPGPSVPLPCAYLEDRRSCDARIAGLSVSACDRTGRRSAARVRADRARTAPRDD
mgnify:CR=1 FL=1